MNGFEAGRYVFENYGLPGVQRFVSSPHVSLIGKAIGVAGAASYYNPYIAAASAIPVVYQGGKWLLDQII